MPSKKILKKKKQQVIDIQEKLKNAGSFVLTDYRGLTVDQDTIMRKDMRESGVEYKVVKNNLLKFAVQGTEYEGLESYLTGPTAIAMSQDQVAPAKILKKYSKEFKAMEIKVGAVDGRIIDVTEVEQLASLPSKEELIAKLMGSINMPITGLVNVLNGNIRGLAVALQAIVDQKQSESA